MSAPGGRSTHAAQNEWLLGLEKWVECVEEFFGGCITEPGPVKYHSATFSAPTPVTSPRTLQLVDALKVGISRPSKPADTLPASCVGFDPPSLAPGQMSFRLVVDSTDADGRPGGTYWGMVSVAEVTPSGSGGGPGLFSFDETVPVWITIP